MLQTLRKVSTNGPTNHFLVFKYNLASIVYKYGFCFNYFTKSNYAQQCLKQSSGSNNILFEKLCISVHCYSCCEFIDLNINSVINNLPNNKQQDLRDYYLTQFDDSHKQQCIKQCETNLKNFTLNSSKKSTST